MKATGLCALLLGLGLSFFFAKMPRISAQATPPPAVDNDDIGGVVTGAQGPEAGVWVIAETRATPTHLIRIVATDDRGRYVVPDLPSGGIRCVGPRLWVDRLSQNENHSGKDRQPESRPRSR